MKNRSIIRKMLAFPLILGVIGLGSVSMAADKVAVKNRYFPSAEIAFYTTSIVAELEEKARQHCSSRSQTLALIRKIKVTSEGDFNDRQEGGESVTSATSYPELTASAIVTCQ